MTAFSIAARASLELYRLELEYTMYKPRVSVDWHLTATKTAQKKEKRSLCRGDITALLHAHGRFHFTGNDVKVLGSIKNYIIHEQCQYTSYKMFLSLCVLYSVFLKLYGQEQLNVCPQANLSFLFISSSGNSFNSFSSFIGMQIAVERINDDDTILPDYTLGYSTIGDAMVFIL